MSATLVAVAKKVAVMLASDKRTWKVVGMFIAMLIVIALLPVIVLLAMGNSLTSSGNQDIDFGAEFLNNLTSEQQQMFTDMESDGKAIEDELTSLNLKTQIVKAQVIYLTYFDEVQKGENFFAQYCSCFKNANGNDEFLINMLNGMFGLNISYEDFMRSYGMIHNVSIDKYQFVNMQKRCLDGLV